MKFAFQKHKSEVCSSTSYLSYMMQLTNLPVPVFPSVQQEVALKVE